MNPCGAGVDYLRKCYVSVVRPFADSNQTAVIRWYWAPEGAPVLRGPMWRSSTWYQQDIDGQYPPAPTFGEARSVPFRWSPGRAGQQLALALCFVGDQAWLRDGIPSSALVANPPPLPACCQFKPQLGAGGILLGGLALLARVARGGLRFGGITVPIPRAAGGLLLGGGLLPIVHQADGGLLLGGDEFPVIPLAAGGLLLGGIGQEPMALLYCSLRRNATLSLPSSINTLIPWDTVEQDPSGMFSGGAPTRITVPQAGVYVVSHQIFWPSTGAAYQTAGEMLLNGAGEAILYSGGVTPAWPLGTGGTTLQELAAGDYLEISASQAAGFALSPGTTAEQRASFRVAGLAAAPFAVYSASSQTSQAVTDGAAFYDIPGLSIANVPPGTYLFDLFYVSSFRNGFTRTIVANGANATLWPIGGNMDSRNNNDNDQQLAASGVIVVAATTTVKVRGAASGAISNYTIFDRHLTLTKIA